MNKQDQHVALDNAVFALEKGGPSVRDNAIEALHAADQRHGLTYDLAFDTMRDFVWAMIADTSPVSLPEETGGMQCYSCDKWFKHTSAGFCTICIATGEAAVSTVAATPTPPTLATVAAANDEAFARGVEAAAKVADEQTRLNVQARIDRADDALAFEFQGLGDVIAAAIRLLSQGGGKANG